ncbi:MAG: gamma-glutamyl-gamma-aminobutyrate hydrolase family protein [Cyanobacteria bacterium P01_E01_bin.34]
MLTIAVIDCGSSKVQQLASIVEGIDCQIATIPLTGANEYDFARFDGVVISGGPHLFTDRRTSKDLIQQFEFIDRLQMPILGICLGHQALALRSGSKAFLGAERRGSEAISVIIGHELFRYLPRGFSVTEDHCEGITLPSNFQLLASSAHYEVEAMASTTYPHFGVQFHPEVSGDVGEIVIRNFCTIVRLMSQHGDGLDLGRSPF